MDYREFLQNGKAELRLPYAAGLKTCDDKRTWRLRQRLRPGWYRFREAGRYLQVIEPIEPEFEAWDLPVLRGYLAQGRFITSDSMDRLFGLPAGEQPARYTPIRARRWFDGHLWFEMSDFESEAEEAVRRAFEEEDDIADIKGVTPPLAQAFLLDFTEREMAREAERRRQEQAEADQRAAELARWQESIEGRIALALSHSGAELMDWRRAGDSRAVVRYRIGGQRFDCLIDTGSLQILDAGICLEGTDEALNLSSLPAAVQEAVLSGQLHVTWRR